MYTDVGSTTHYMYLGEDLSADNTTLNSYYYRGTICYDFNYSGASQCMGCGEIGPELDSETSLVCVKCEVGHYCSHCGDRIYDDNSYSIGEELLCEYCYNELTSRCSECEDDYFLEDLKEISVMLPIDDKLADYLDERYGKCNDEEIKHSLILNIKSVCEDCLKDIYTKLENGADSIHQYYNDFGTQMNVVYLNEIKKEYLRHFVSYLIADDYLSNSDLFTIARTHCSRYDYCVLYK